MRDLFPYLCPFADCKIKNKMWDVRSESETHLNEQHPIPTAQERETQRYAFTCKICLRTFQIDDHSREEEFSNPACLFRITNIADNMERIASSVVDDYGPYSSAPSRRRVPKRRSKLSKTRRRRGHRPGMGSGHDSSSSGRDEEAMSGWSSEGSAGSRG